jgi:hypothetical protein
MAREIPERQTLHGAADEIAHRDRQERGPHPGRMRGSQEVSRGGGGGQVPGVDGREREPLLFVNLSRRHRVGKYATHRYSRNSAEVTGEELNRSLVHALVDEKTPGKLDDGERKLLLDGYRAAKELAKDPKTKVTIAPEADWLVDVLLDPESPAPGCSPSSVVAGAVSVARMARSR